MTKEDLSQLEPLRKEIEDLKRRKRECEDRATATTQLLDGMPHAHKGSDKVGMFGADAAWYGMMIDNALARYREEYRRAWEFIEAISDSEIRTIFRYRYVDGMTWPAVAFAIGEYDECYPRQKHDRYLRKTEQNGCTDFTG